MSMPPRRSKGSASRHYTVREVGDITNLSRQWVSQIIRRYNERGPDGFLPEKRKKAMWSGRTRILRDFLEEELKVLLKEGVAQGKPWTSAKVQTWIRDKAYVEVHPSTAWRYLKRLSPKNKGAQRRSNAAKGNQEQDTPLFNALQQD